MRNRRILLLAVAFFVLVSAAGTAFVYRQHVLDERAVTARAVGMEAAQAGAHKRTLDQVGRYLLRFGQDEDAEALFAYANARSEIPLPNSKHIVQAISLLRKTLEIDPDHAAARSRLLDLYLEVGYGEEALQLANDILAVQPANLDALRAQATAYGWRSAYDEALECTAAIAAIEPANIDNHLLAMTLLERKEASEAELLAYAGEHTDFENDDARYLLLQSVAHDLAGNRAAATESAVRAAERAPVDPELVSLINVQLTRLDRLDVSLALLKRTADACDDLEIHRSLVRRLYEAGDFEGVLTRTGDTPLDELDSTLLAMRALATAAITEHEAILPIVEELDARRDDPIAEAWAPLLRAMWIEHDESPLHVIALCDEALQNEPKNPFFHYIEGLANERLGERDLAIQAFEEASRLAPAWAEPLLRSAGLYNELGRKNEAAALAVVALNRAPQNISAAITAAEYIASDIDGLSENDERQLLDLVTRVQEANPGEPRTLPVFVELLLRNGDEETALEAIRETLAHADVIPSRTLTRLARVSGKYELGLAGEIRAALSEKRVVSPAAVYARAIALHEAGETERGRRAIAAAAEAHGDSVEWAVVLAQYLERIDADDAALAWAQAADADPANTRLQQRVLDSEHAWHDKDLIRRVIDRLKEQTGQDAVGWRVAEARWLLETDASTKAAAEATVMLNEAIRASVARPQHHVLMATALERLDNLETAIEHLTTASQLAPESAAITIELARLLNERGETDRAAQLAEEALRNGELTASMKRRIASLLATQNEIGRAIQLILETYPPEQRENPPDLLLAMLYRQSGRLAEAEDILERLLDESPGPDAVQLAAEVYALQGRDEEAQRALAMLDELPLDDGRREFLRAEHHRKFAGRDDAEETLRLYAEAVAKNGAKPVWWRRYIQFVLETGKGSDAVALIDAAQAACPNDDFLSTLHEHSEILEATLAQPVAARLLKAALDDPDRLDGAIEALTAFEETIGQEPAALVARFRQLTEPRPRFLALKMELARLCANLKQYDEAARVAMDAMRTFPDAVEPAWLAAEALGAAGRWEESLQAARAWHDRAKTEPFPAVLMLAIAQVRLQRYTEALDTLEPYLAQASDEADAFSRLRTVQAEALAGAGRTEEAAAVMRPRLSESAPWRMEWIRLAQQYGTEDAPAWLETVAPLIPDEATNERTALAAAWHNLAQRTEQDAYAEKARALLDELATRPDASPNTFLALAMVAESQGDTAAAETNYRRVLELEPSLAQANNNLAMVLVNRGENLDEAVRLAEEAVEAEPYNANFHDTLAQAHLAVGDVDSAIVDLAKAAEIEPSNPKWRERLERLQEQAGV